MIRGFPNKAAALAALGGAFALALAPAAASAATKLTATLTGASETGGGDPDGSGTFSAQVDPEAGDFCFTLTVAKIAKPIAAHVHKGAAGADGGPVITVAVTGADGDDCVAVEPDLLKAIVAEPAGYYVNVHTPDFQKGAIRGQLAN